MSLQSCAVAITEELDEEFCENTRQGLQDTPPHLFVLQGQRPSVDHAPVICAVDARRPVIKVAAAITVSF